MKYNVYKNVFLLTIALSIIKAAPTFNKMQMWTIIKSLNYTFSQIVAIIDFHFGSF